MLAVLVGGLVSILVALFGTPMLARFLRSRGIGQPIQDEVTHHAAKSGTPTMGGVMLSVCLVVGYVAARLELRRAPTTDGVAVVAVIVAAAGIGFLDDWLKVRRKRNLGGLRPRQKSALQAIVIGGFCAHYLLAGDHCTNIGLTRCSNGIPAGRVLWVVFATVFFWATVNAVNFADGIEGLLSGLSSVTFAALALVALWVFRHEGLYHVTNALDLTMVATCLAAAALGFLWWNGNPMTIFMGDTGSMAIGAGVASLALHLNVPLLVAVLGLVYVGEGVSVGLQIYTWRWHYRPRQLQRRLFRMAPVHHHFELVGWSDATILTRFWIMNGVAAAAALMIFYADALRFI